MKIIIGEQIIADRTEQVRLVAENATAHKSLYHQPAFNFYFPYAEDLNLCPSAIYVQFYTLVH